MSNYITQLLDQKFKILYFLHKNRKYRINSLFRYRLYILNIIILDTLKLMAECYIRDIIPIIYNL